MSCGRRPFHADVRLAGKTSTVTLKSEFRCRYKAVVVGTFMQLLRASPSNSHNESEPIRRPPLVTMPTSQEVILEFKVSIRAKTLPVTSRFALSSVARTIVGRPSPFRVLGTERHGYVSSHTALRWRQILQNYFIIVNTVKPCVT